MAAGPAGDSRPARDPEEGRVEAMVNDHSITTRDVLERVGKDLYLLPDTDDPVKTRARRGRILQNGLLFLVEEQLLLAKAHELIGENESAKRQIEEQVKIRMEKLERKAGGPHKLRAMLNQLGLTRKQYEKKQAEDVKVGFVRHKFVQANISISPFEAREYYLSHLDEFHQDERVRFRQIFLAFSQYGTKEEAGARAQGLVQKIHNGHAFEELVRAESDGPHADQGGLWDYTRRTALKKPVAHALFRLHAGEVSGPVESDIGYHILQVVDIKKARTISLEEAYEQIRERLLADKLRRRERAFIGQLYRENYVEIDGKEVHTPPDYLYEPAGAR